MSRAGSSDEERTAFFDSSYVQRPMQPILQRLRLGYVLMLAVAVPLAVHTAFPTWPWERSKRLRTTLPNPTHSPLLGLAEDVGHCSEILKNGIYDHFNSGSRYAIQADLKKFDESYSFHDYQKDVANSKSEGHGTSVDTKVSGSYAAFSANVDNSVDVNGQSMSEDQFNIHKKEVVSEKHMLRSRQSSQSAATVTRDVVSPQIRNMYDQCVKFSDAQMMFETKASPGGHSLTISMKYTLGSGGQQAIPPKIEDYSVSPSAAHASCRMMGNYTLPVTMEIGVTYTLICMRKYVRDHTVLKQGVTVVVATNRAGAFQTTMADEAETKRFEEIDVLKDEVADLQKELQTQTIKEQADLKKPRCVVCTAGCGVGFESTGRIYTQGFFGETGDDSQARNEKDGTLSGCSAYSLDSMDDFELCCEA